MRFRRPMEGLTLRLVDGVYDDQGVGALLGSGLLGRPVEGTPTRTIRSCSRATTRQRIRTEFRAARSLRSRATVVPRPLGRCDRDARPDYRRAPPGGVFDRTFLALGRTPKVKRESGGADSGKQSPGGAFSPRAAVHPPLSRRPGQP